MVLIGGSGGIVVIGKCLYEVLMLLVVELLGYMGGVGGGVVVLLSMVLLLLIVLLKVEKWMVGMMKGEGYRMRWEGMCGMLVDGKWEMKWWWGGSGDGGGVGGWCRN